MPISMTFVLILGIPSSGATVNADMLPTTLRWLHEELPFGAGAALVLWTHRVATPATGQGAGGGPMISTP